MNFKKILAGTLICAMSFSLFGCELVSVNKERDNAQVIFTVGDREYKKEGVRSLGGSSLAAYQVSEDKVGEELYEENMLIFVESYAKQEAMYYYAIQNGYGEKLSEEDKKKLDEDYKAAEKRYNEEIYEEQKEGYLSSQTEDEGQTGMDGMTVDESGMIVQQQEAASDEQKEQEGEQKEEELDDAAKAKIDQATEEAKKGYLMDLGVDNIEEYKTVLLNRKAYELYTEKLKKDVKVNDDEIKAKYDSLLSEQKKKYSDAPSEYVTATSNEDSLVLYTPAGFRRVKHVLIKIDDATSTQISTLESEINALEGDEKSAKQDELNKLKEEAYSKIEARANEALNKAKAGEDFDKLIKEYGEDPGTESQPEGYLMHARMTEQYVSEFQEAGMALEKVGDISDLVKTNYGYHIMLYASDVAEKEEKFENVKEKVKEAALEEKQEKAVETKTNDVYDMYVADGTVKTYFDRLKKVSVPGKK